jgi:hypothetical protein
MAKKLQLRGGTTSEHSTFTGAVREVTVDTTKDSLVVHDGTTAGGIPIAKSSDITLGTLSVTADAAELNKLDGVTASTAELNHLTGVTSNIQTQLNTKLASGGTLATATITTLTSTTANITTVDLGNWTVTEALGVLKFATLGVNKMKLDASGNLTVTGNVTGYGTV